jgi:hypothetical protein
MNDSVSNQEIDNYLDFAASNSEERFNVQFPVLPRYGWQDQKAFFKALIKAKRSLDIAEISALLNSDR